MHTARVGSGTIGAAVFAAALVLGATPVVAQVSLDVPAATYKVDPRHTQIIFAIQHMGLSTFYGRFGALSGSLTFDPKQPESSALSVTVDMTNIQTHVEELDRELTKNVFHADKFPTATFTATSITKASPTTGTVTGNLTLAGVTKPVTLNVTFDGGRDSPMPFQPYRIGFNATTSVKRSDFGLTGMMWSGLVGDDVSLMIECELEKQ
ncbi:MAG TPA: YceI family protein [Rhizomicrobium sp.]|nr:YceI family protein [Rhizomicrobium sp.]